MSALSSLYSALLFSLNRGLLSIADPNFLMKDPPPSVFRLFGLTMDSSLLPVPIGLSQKKKTQIPGSARRAAGYPFRSRALLLTYRDI